MLGLTSTGCQGLRILALLIKVEFFDDTKNILWYETNPIGTPVYFTVLCKAIIGERLHDNIHKYISVIFYGQFNQKCKYEETPFACLSW